MFRGPYDCTETKRVELRYQKFATIFVMLNTASLDKLVTLIAC